MSPAPKKRTISLLAWCWRHVSATVAVLLIGVALYAGYRLGAPGRATTHPEPQPDQAKSHADQPAWYTCSMHPSVRLSDPDAKCPICFMDLIPVGAGDGGEGPTLTLTTQAVAASRIETAKAARFFPAAEVRLYGKLAYDETFVARLTAYFPARIDRLFVNYTGVPVARGDHLAEVYSPELLAALEELRQARQAAAGAGAASEIVRQVTLETLAAAREKLRLFGISDEQTAAVEDGSFTDDRITIYAPIGGIVTNLAVREGDYVTTGQPIATVADLSRLWLDLEAYESQLPLLRWGQPVEFTVESHPGDRFTGRVSFIEPIIDDATRTAAVRVAVDNTDRRLKPGMFASAVVRPRVGADGAVLGAELAGRWVCPMHPTIVKDAQEGCDACGMDLVPAESLGVVGDPRSAQPPLVIPRTAVLFTGARSVVYVQSPDAESPTYEAREVTLGSRAGEFYIVREGLAEQDAVVVNGAFRLDSEMQITARPSMMSAERQEDSREAAPAAPPEFLDSLTPVYEAYLDAQERLAADDFEGYLRAAAALGNAVGSTRESMLVGEGLGAWRLAASALRPREEPADIEAARAAFERMSDAAIDLQRRFGHAGDRSWRHAFCPMAFDFEGADWLQRGEEINNPYFGASMLQCGEILEEFPPRDAPGAGEEATGHE
jgi:Cu(I)/Ag(I) efflux system membrane fusion protein